MSTQETAPEPITKQWLRGAMQEAIAEWQPSNADVVNLSVNMMQEMNRIENEINAFRHDIKRMIRELEKHGIQLPIESIFTMPKPKQEKADA